MQAIQDLCFARIYLVVLKAHRPILQIYHLPSLVNAHYPNHIFCL